MLQTCFRAVAGGALIVSGLLAIFGLTGSAVDLANPELLAAEVKIAVGSVVALGLLGTASRWLGVAIYAAFVIYLGFEIAMVKSVSCGCFGKAVVSPWAVLTFDLFVIGGLIASGGVAAASNQTRRRWSGVIAVGLVVAAGIVSWQIAPTLKLNASTPSLAIPVDPTAWIGQKLPILDEIDIGGELAEGRWGVVLYRQFCSCDPNALAKRFPQRSVEKPMRYAAVLLAGAGNDTASVLPDDVRRGRVVADKPQPIFAPVYVVLDDGVVVSVERDEFVSGT